ncbi:MAG: hypothetical protein HY235_12355 [Acidobacteria bacterium]|nr:hypothetical protein [Acidobacteriota bacterium]
MAALVAAAFAWLSWRVIEQDRALDRQRLIERRDADGAAALNSLQGTLLDILDQVAAGTPPSDDAVLAVFSAAGVEAFPRSRLLYYPSPPPAREPPAELFAAADTLEFNDAARALEALAAPARSTDAAVRAGALLRIGRIQRKVGRYDEALRAYEQLAGIEGIRVGGEPVDLAARHIVCQILAKRRDKARLARETEQLRKDLRSGRWQLSKPVYSLYANWLNTADPKGEAWAAAVATLWSDWPNVREVKGWSRVSHLWIDNQPVLVFKNATPGRLMAYIARPAFLEKRWRGTLTDDSGRVLLGSASGAPDTIRLPVASGLPWTLHLSPSNNEISSAGSAQRRWLIIVGLALIGLFAAAATYFVARVVAREFALARLQSDFVSAVSHEFRTPLTTIRQLTEMLHKRRVPDEAKRDEYYDLLGRESERLQRLVEDLLDFRRMEAGAIEFSFEPLDPAGLLRGVVADFQQRAGPEGYHVELTAASDVPPIRGDRASLRRAVWNLLENALKYSPGCRTIWVELGEHAKQVAIRVRDQGIGIPLNEQASVLKKFVRGREAKSANIPGTGLGLAMVHQIVRSHGGRVEVRSRPGEGSTFTLLLPALD